MAEPVNLTTADLMAEIGRLTMEVKARAAREDQLLGIVESLRAEVSRLLSPEREEVKEVGRQRNAKRG